MEEARVQKFISQSGYCSRRKAEDLIDRELVKVNGETINLGHKCLSTDKIEVEGNLININKDKVYIIMNKAKGYVCSKDDPHNDRNIFNLLKTNDRDSSLFNVGRLDKYTSGLIILTNDGDFAQKIIHPSSSINKEYITCLDRDLETKDKNILEKGIRLDGIVLKPCTIRHISNNQHVVIISEGRKRQIRRMFEERDYEVTSLKRIKLGNLDLKEFDIKEGEYVFTTKEFLEKNIF